jgi:uncharacterized protein YecE (DUF72 family)
VVFVGTSGWQYRHWKRVFYPEKLPQQMWLAYYAERFQTVEVNNTFYNLPEKSVFAQWERIAPRDFVFALKMSRYLTHLKRLRDPREPVQRFMERAGALGDKRGPILLQLPPNLEVLPDLLGQTLSEFPPEVRIAVEFRNPTWFTSEVAKILEQHGAALCLADSPRRNQPMWRTAPWGFVRFHEGKGPQAPGYERQALVRWVGRIAEMWDADAHVFVYFNNDAAGYAIKDAITFAELAGAAGLRTTRVPSAFGA